MPDKNSISRNLPILPNGQEVVGAEGLHVALEPAGDEAVQEFLLIDFARLAY